MTAIWWVLCVATACGLFALLGRSGAVRQWTDRPPSDLSAPLGWTSPRDLPTRRPLAVEATLALGTIGARLVIADPTTPTMVIGATGSAKTSALVVPQILEWDGSVISTSVKSDVLEATAGWRSTLGSVAVFDPAGSLPDSLAHLARPWTPLAAARSWPDASRTAAALVSAALDSPGGDRFWAQQAQLLLSGLLFRTAADPGGTMRDVVRQLGLLTDGSGFARLAKDISNLARRGGENAELAALAVAPIAAYPPNTAGSVVATVQAALGVYLQGAAANIRVDDPRLIDADELLGSTSTLYMVGPPREQELYRPLYTALLSHLVASAYTQAARESERRLRLPLLLSLDEVANIAPLPELPTVASTARSFGIQLVTVVQDLAQLEAAYGPAGAATILSNHASVAVLPRIKDLGTLTWAETILGDTEIDRRSVAIAFSHGRQHDGDRRSDSDGTTRTENHTIERVSLASKARIAGMPDGEVLAVIAADRVQLRQRRYYADPGLASRAAFPIPGPPRRHLRPPRVTARPLRQQGDMGGWQKDER